LAESIETKRRLAAIFEADVEGYSRLMGADEVATLEALTARREILDEFVGLMMCARRNLSRSLVLTAGIPDRRGADFAVKYWDPLVEPYAKEEANGG